MRIRITRALLDEIHAIADNEQKEICGLLFGGDGVITSHQLCENVALDPFRHFEIDPSALIAAHRCARQGGRTIVGCYHSHPSGIARPSLTDAQQAAADGSLWLIFAGMKATLWSANSDGHGGVQFIEAQLHIC